MTAVHESVNESAIARVAALPAVREAAETGARLTALWPLTDAKQMDNDAKYAENLQVRLTRMIARVTTGEDVTVPDAEFVYEGADEIPGRPQQIVDALLAANDAYDTMIEYRDAHDAAVLFEAALAMGIDWSADVVAALRDTLARAESGIAGVTAVGAADDDAGSVDSAAAGDGVASDYAATGEVTAHSVDALAYRFGAALSIGDELLSIIGDAAADRAADDDSTQLRAAAQASLPILLLINELRERLSVPRICLTDDQYRALLAARADAAAIDDVTRADTLTATAHVIAPIAAAEWSRHYDDVMWDPAEAKRRAKEEDERKNKEALAAKFAHIKDDPTKPEVEL